MERPSIFNCRLRGGVAGNLEKVDRNEPKLEEAKVELLGDHLSPAYTPRLTRYRSVSVMHGVTQQMIISIC